MKDNVVSIILPVYNAGEFLPQCLESIKRQSYKSIQVIAIDDKSRDNSYSILKKFQKRYKSLEVYKNKKRYGLAVCYNRGLKRARGRFITFMNPNDINSLNRFKRQVNFFTNNPKSVAVGTQYTNIDKKLRKLERSNLPKDHDVIYDTLLSTSSLFPETLMINRELLPKDLLYFTSTKPTFMFAEILVKLFQYGKVSNISHSLYFHRVGIKRYTRSSSRLRHVISMTKLWIASRANDNRLPLRSLFPPLVKGV